MRWKRVADGVGVFGFFGSLETEGARFNNVMRFRCYAITRFVRDTKVFY